MKECFKRLDRFGIEGIHVGIEVLIFFNGVIDTILILNSSIYFYHNYLTQ